MVTGDARSGPDKGLIGRVADRVTGRVVETIDPDLVLDHVDLDALLDRIDVNRLLDRVDLTRLLDRVDVDRLLSQVDVNRLLDTVDVDRLLARADVERLVRRSGVPDLITESTASVAGSALDAARRQVAGVDTLLDRAVDRLVRRSDDEHSQGPPLLTQAELGVRKGSVTGDYAGPISRAAAAAVDVGIVTGLFTVGYGGADLLTGAFLNRSLSGDWSAPVAAIALATWAFGYVFLSLAVAGRTPGKAIVGLRVTHRTGHPIGVLQSLVRTSTLPVSAVLFPVTAALVVFQREHRVPHDLAAGTAVVYDWGERAAVLSAPLSDFLARHTGDSPGSGA